MLEEQKSSSNLVRMWLRPCTPLGVEVGDRGELLVHVEASHDLGKTMISRNYQKEVEGILATQLGKPVRLVLSAKQTQASPEEFHLAPPPSHEEPAAQAAPVSALSFPSSASIAVQSFHPPQANNLIARYTFDNYVVGNSNQLAHASCVAVANNPGRLYNPVFLFSPPALGKTHLLHAIGNHLLSRNPAARVIYISAERFMNEYIESIQHKRMPQFRARFRDNTDLILIDDIHAIAGKEGTEDEFFHTFNSLHNSMRQLVITSDRPPKEIEGLAERLRTRFEWGLVISIQPPEIETRIAILKAKSESDDLYLPDEVATFLASHIKSNVRELEGVLTRLKAQASLTGAEISMEMAKTELMIAIPEESSNLTAEAILAAVARHFGLKLSELRATTRAKNISEPRQIAMYLIRKYTALGYREIGAYFGGKDHSTIVHACGKIERALDAGQDEIRSSVEAIQNSL